jgi:hypothetical protein
MEAGKVISEAGEEAPERIPLRWMETGVTPERIGSTLEGTVPQRDHLADSRSYRTFRRLGIAGKLASKSTLNASLKPLQAATLEAIHRIVVGAARAAKWRPGGRILFWLPTLAGRRCPSSRRYRGSEAEMSRLEAIEEEIKRLAPAEWAELRNWVLERDAEEWDRQIERDATSGKLDRLFEEAMADHRAGKSREL